MQTDVEDGVRRVVGTLVFHSGFAGGGRGSGAGKGARSGGGVEGPRGLQLCEAAGRTGLRHGRTSVLDLALCDASGVARVALRTLLAH